MGASGGGAGGHKIEDEGISVVDRDILNFVGTGVTADDFGGKTRVTITAGGGSDVNVQVKEGGINVGIPRNINFTDVNDFIISEDAGNNEIDITINRNIANGIAGLDASALVPLAQLGGITTAEISATAAITFSQLANISTNRLIGRNTAGAGAIEQLTHDATLEFNVLEFRRAAITGDISIPVASNVAAISAGVILDADINAAAAIAFTKLADLVQGNILVGSVGNQATSVNPTGDINIAASGLFSINAGVIIDADINASAAIAFSKFAILTSGNLLVGSAGNVVTSVNPTGDIDISNTGVFSINSGVIVNADINATAGIDLTKLNDSGFLQGDIIKHNGTDFVRFAKGTANQQIRVNAGGTDLEFFTVAGGSTHNILSPTHLDSVTATVVSGDLIFGNVTPAWDRLPIGADNSVLAVAGTVLNYQTIVNDLIDAAAAIDLSKLNDSGFLQGDLIKHNGTDLIRFAKGTGLQQIRVNAGGTDLEFFTPSGAGGGSYNLARSEGTLISTDRIAFNWLDTAELNFLVVDDAGGNETEISATIVTASIALAKLANINTNRLLGRNTASAGVIEELTHDATLEFNVLEFRRAAITGDISIPVGSNVAAISTGVIVNADINATAAIALSKIADTSFLQGDLIKHNGTDYARFAKGTANQQIRVNAGATDLEFFTASGGADHNILSLTHLDAVTATVVAGDLIFGNATPAWDRLPIGADNLVLAVAGTALNYQTIVNDLIDAAAAIAFSKLASLTSGNILVGSAGNVVTSVNPTGDIDISATGVFSINTGVIVNADINAAAAIVMSKITGTRAQFDTALSDDNFAFEGQANTWGAFNQNIAATGKWQEAGINISPIGLQSLFIGAGSFDEVTSNAVATRIIGTGDNRKQARYMEFTNAVTEFMTVGFEMPNNWNLSTVQFEIHWTSQVEGAGVVRWGLAGVSISNDILHTSAFGTEITVDDTQTVLNDDHLTPRSAAVTIALVPNDKDWIWLRVRRLGADAADTFTQPAQFFGITIYYSTNAAVVT